MKTQSTHKMPTMDQITPAIRAAVQNVIAARKHAAAERAKMAAVDAELLEKHALYVRAEYLERRGDGVKEQRITEEKHIYLTDLDGAPYNAYMDERRARIAAMGYNLKGDYCPALIAEHEQSQAEHALIEAAAALFPWATANKLLCSGLETYHQYIELWIKLETAIESREDGARKIKAMVTASGNDPRFVRKARAAGV